MNVSFKGNVFAAGAMSGFVNKKDAKSLKEYANKNNCDVVVLNGSYYMGGEKTYDTLIVKEEKTTGTNTLSRNVFDFAKNEISYLGEINFD